MSEPTKIEDGSTIRNIIQHIMVQIISGESSLNMEPNPIPEDKQSPDNNGYLSDIDFYVKHSLEHFDYSVYMLNELYSKINRLENNIINIMNDPQYSNDSKLIDQLEQIHDSI